MRRRTAPTTSRPRRNDRGLWAYALACCRLHEKRAVLDAGGSSLVRHESERFTDPPPGLAMELPRHAPQQEATCYVRDAFTLVAGRCPARVRGAKPVHRHAGAELAMFPFGAGRPRRPVCFVNPGGGWLAYGCNLPAKTISPALRAFLAGQVFFASRRSIALRPQAVQPARPPAGRITTGRDGRPRSTERKFIMANIGTFTAEKDGFTGIASHPDPQRQGQVGYQRQGDTTKAPLTSRLQAAGPTSARYEEDQ